jgi:lipopolysaccharide/colanic/teichoic acid biosynthesis glycosyltransferase
MLGGVAKRAIDLTVALVTAPAWLPVMLLAAGVAKLRDRSPVFLSHERVGYGGRSFKCFSLRISPLAKADEIANDPAKAMARRFGALAASLQCHPRRDGAGGPQPAHARAA